MHWLTECQLPSNRLEVLLTAQTKEFNDALGRASRSVDDLVGNIQGKAQNAALALGAIAAGGAALVKSFVDAAAEMESYETRLKAITGSAKEAEAQLVKMTEIARRTPFELPQVVQAGVTLRSLGQDVDTFLPLAADLARVLGRDLPGTSQILAKALTGSQDGLTALVDSGALTKKELEQFGAVMKKDGSIATDTAGNLQKFQRAMQALLQSKFGGVAAAESETLGGALSNLSDTFGELQRELGEQLAPTFKALTETLAGALGWLQNLPEPVKQLIAYGTLVTTVIVGVGAALAALIAGAGAVISGVTAIGGAMTALGVAGAAVVPVVGTELVAAATAGASAMGVASGAATGLSASLAAALVPAAAIVAVTALLAAGGIAYIKSIEASTAALEAQIQAEEKVLKGLRAHRDLLHQTAEAMRARGTTDVEITKAMLGMEQLAQKAREAGNEQKAAEYEAEAARLRSMRSEFSGTEAAKQEAIQETLDAQKAASEEGAALLDQYKQRATAGFYETKQAQLQAMDETLARLRQGDEDAKKSAQELEVARVALARDARKETLDEALAALKTEAAAGEVSKQQEAERLRSLAATYGDLSDERQKLTLEATRLDKEAAQEQIQAKLETLDAQKQLLEGTIQVAEQALKSGNDIRANEERIGAALRERAKLEQQAIRERADAEKQQASDPMVRAEVEQKADAEIRASRQRLTQDLKQLSQEVLQQEQEVAQARAALGEAEGKTADARLAGLKEALARGEDVLEQLKQEMEARQKLAEQTIKAKAEAAAMGKSEAEAAAIRKTADEEINASRETFSQAMSKLNRDVAERDKKTALERIEIEKEAAENRIETLERQAALGKNVAAQQRTALQEVLRLTIQEMQARAELEKQNKTSAEQANIEARLRQDIKKATEDTAVVLKDLAKNQKSAADDAKRQADELVRAKGASADLNSTMGGLSGDEGPMDSSRAAWRARVAAREADEQAGAEKNIELNQAEGERMGKTRGGQTAAEIVRDEQAAAKEAERQAGLDKEAEKRRGGFDERLNDAKKGSSEAPGSASVIAARLASVLEQGVPVNVAITVDGQGVGVDWKSNYAPNRVPGQR